MKRLLKWLIVVVTVMLATIVVLVYNPGLARGPLERYLTGVAGYPVRLEGDLNLDLGKTTRLSAKNIRVSGPDWARQPQLLDIGHLKLELVTASVFEDILVLNSLQVESLELNLETDQNGKGNWLSANEPPVAGDEPVNNSGVVFNNLDIRDTNIRYHNGKKDLDHLLTIVSLQQHQQADGLLNTIIKGALNSRPIDITGTLGPYDNLVNGRDISFSANGSFGGLSITSSGTIDDLLNPRKPEFKLDLKGPDIDEITGMLGIDDLGSGGFDLHAHGSDTGTQYEAEVNGRVGDVSLQASAKASDLLHLDELDLTVKTNGPSLGAFTRAFGVENWPDKPFRLEADVDRIGGTLNIDNLNLYIGGTHLTLDALLTDFPNLDASRVKLNVEGDNIEQFRELLGVSGVASGPFKLHGSLSVSPQSVELLQVELTTSLGQATVSGTLGAAPDYIGSKFQLHLDGNDAHAVMSAFGIDALPKRPFNFNTRLELVKNGISIERGVLGTVGDGRLELDGFIAFNPGIVGSDLTFKASGVDVSQILDILLVNTPVQGYTLSGRIRVQESGIEVEEATAQLNGITLSVGGLLTSVDDLTGSSFDFKISSQDLTALQSFRVMGDFPGLFVPGQPYQASGRFAIDKDNWQLSNVKGQIGATEFSVNGNLSQQPDLSGSSVHFSIKGPGLSSLLLNPDKTSFPVGPFEAGARISLSNSMLTIDNFDFNTTNAHGKGDLGFGWPFNSDNMDMHFNLDLEGDDIRNVLPPIDSFAPEKAAFRIITEGQIQDALISLKRFDANIGDLQASLKGKVDSIDDDRDSHIAVKIFTPDISSLGRINGDKLPGLNLDISADFAGNARQFVLQNLKASLGDSRLEGSLGIALKDSRANIRLTAESPLIDLRPFQKPSARNPDIQPKKKADRLIPPTPLPLDALASTDITLGLKIGELKYQKTHFNNLILDAQLLAGNLNVSRFSGDGPRGKLNASLSVKPVKGPVAEVTLDLNAQNLLLNLTGQPADRLDQIPTIDLDFHASGSGDNLQNLAGSLNGSLYMGSEGGTLEDVNLSLLDTYILEEIFSLVLPDKGADKYLNITCLATNLKIENGLVTTAPAIAISTDKILLASKGTLDLATEKLNLDLKATPTRVLKISASELFNPYILVSGTLSHPSVKLDPAKVILGGGAAIGTAGISVLAKGLLDRMDSATPLCEEIRKQPGQTK